MSARRFAHLANRLRQAAADAAWVQWRALGGQVAARLPGSIVDPEALLLVSLSLADDEPRLRDMLSGFARGDTGRISIQRLRQLVPLFPESATSRLGGFAHDAFEAGDHRWRGLAGKPSARGGRPGKVAGAADRILEPGSLMLRLRSALGLDARADVLCFLLGRYGEPADIRDMTDDLGYAANSVRGACEDLAEAGFIRGGSERPVLYRLAWRRWQHFLDITMVPWHPWGRAYGFSLGLAQWLRELAAQAPPAGVERMLLVEWLDRHRGELERLDIGGDAPVTPETAARSFEGIVEALAGTLERNA